MTGLPNNTVIDVPNTTNATTALSSARTQSILAVMCTAQPPAAVTAGNVTDCQIRGRLQPPNARESQGMAEVSHPRAGYRRGI